MALEDLIAQRIAATAASRRRLEESVYSLEPIRAGLSAAQNQSFQARSLINQKRGLELQEKEYAASQAGVPSVLAQPVAEGMVPETPVPVGADMPYGGSIAAADMAARVQRRGKIDAIVSALGAHGGANLLAKLAAYTAMDRQAKEDAGARLKVASDAATYARVLAGGPGSVRPTDDPSAAGRGVDDYGAGQTRKAAADVLKSQQEEDQQTRDWRLKYGSIAPEDLPPEALQQAPDSLFKALMTQRGVGSRFNRSMAFKREQYDAVLANIAADNQRGDAFLNLGNQREGRLALVGAHDKAVRAIAKLEEESGAKVKMETASPDGGWITTYRTDLSVLEGPQKEKYAELVRVRDALNERLGRLGATPESANGETSTAIKPKADPAELDALRTKIDAGTATPEEEARFEQLIGGK